jgi:hypothetical protein
MDDVVLIRTVVDRHWPDLRSTHLAVDVREVTHIGSACLGELIRLNTACASLELRHTQPQLDLLLEVTGLGATFEQTCPRCGDHVPTRDETRENTVGMERDSANSGRITIVDDGAVVHTCDLSYNGEDPDP